LGLFQTALLSYSPQADKNIHKRLTANLTSNLWTN